MGFREYQRDPCCPCLKKKLIQVATLRNLRKLNAKTQSRKEKGLTLRALATLR
jgi:hypothetical protein